METDQEVFKEERALFAKSGITVKNSVFEDGESPLKECKNVRVYDCGFKAKYPLWYCQNVEVAGCSFFDGARAGMWYSDNISIDNSIVASPKNFRRCNNVIITDTTFSDGDETLWNCCDITIKKVFAKGDYFAMNSKKMRVEDLKLRGNYTFDGVKDVEVKNSEFLGRDLFWNSENVRVENSRISGAYLGWNSKGLYFENCIIESLQGLCYVDGLVMKNCRLINTALAFEYSTVEAEIDGKIDSVLNPSGGKIVCGSIGELILERDKIDPDKVKIICKNC